MKNNKIQSSGTWIKDCRIPYQNEDDGLPLVMYKDKSKNLNYFTEDGSATGEFSSEEKNVDGRYPANLLVCDNILDDGTITKQATRKYGKDTTGFNGFSMKNDIKLNKDVIVEGDEGSYSRYFDLDRWFDEK